MSDTVKATVYLQVAPELSRHWPADDPRSILSARVVNSTQKRATKPQAGTVEVKITVEIPKGAFLPLRPEAIIVVPESMTTPHPMQVEAHDANEGDA